MITNLNRRKGQSTVEYAVLIIIIIAALLSVQTYLKRGIQGRIHSSADDIGSQYSPDNTNMLRATKVSSRELQSFGVAGQGVQNTNLLADEITNTINNSSIINTTQEYYGN